MPNSHFEVVACECLYDGACPSLVRKKRRWNKMRYTSEHPPHCHFRCFRRILLSHEHSVKSPLEQARVMDHANDAAFIACMYAVSRLSVANRKEYNVTY